MIQGINHITLSVNNLEVSFHFYHHILGLKPLCKWPHGAYFLAGNDWVCLNVCESKKPVQNKCYTHYAFSVAKENFEAFVHKLKKAHVHSQKENKSEGDSFYFCDPDGHQLELHVGTWQTRIAQKKQYPWRDTEFFL